MLRPAGLSALLLLAISGNNAAHAVNLSETDKPDIIVTGNRAEEAEATADFAKFITWRPSQDKPLPKHYEPVCIQIFGLGADYAEVMAERMRDNIRALNLVLAGNGCTPTLWVGFVPDSHAEVTRLRKDEPAMFGDLKDFEIDRILTGSKASQAWFAREDKGLDGKAMRARTVELNGIEVSVKHNDPWRASRISGTIRVDMIGSIVLFDSRLSAGKSIRQLADYATFRALAPVKDLESEGGNPASILSLFAKDAGPPAGLTEFDWAYLAGYYKLSEGANVASVHDAARRAFLDGLGDAKVRKAGLTAE
jgi:hypothetical protein